MKIAYVAGPYRASTEQDLDQNTRAAEVVAIELWKMGFAAYCLQSNLSTSAVRHQVWFQWRNCKGGLEIVRHCDCLVTVPNWTNSKDAAAEVLLAKDLDKPIFHWPGDINLMDQFAHE